MNITINGDVYITNYGQTLGELTEDVSSDDECDYGECEFYDCDCEEDELTVPLETLIEEYAESLADGCNCFDCVEITLENFVYELIHGM